MSKVKEINVKGKTVFCAIDLHDASMLAGIAVDQGDMKYSTFNTLEDEGMADLIKKLKSIKREYGAREISVAYEASGSGFLLADVLKGHGVNVSVLAPSHLPVSQKSRSNKTDKRDVKRIMDVLRGHALAGGDLPTVWIPTRRLRDDRELVRQRLQLSDEVTRTKNKIHGLLKRNGIRKPANVKCNWSGAHVGWLMGVCEHSSNGCGQTLQSLLRQLDFLLTEVSSMDKALQSLSEQDVYRKKVGALTKVKGVGLITAMTFLTELGDLSRFPNRRALASYMGLVPRTYESGEQNDHKGHISRLGPSRLRKVLNQAAWSLVRWEESWRIWFKEHTQGGKKALRKKMITAVMRRLGIFMWHQALAAQA